MMATVVLILGFSFVAYHIGHYFGGLDMFEYLKEELDEKKRGGK